MDKYNNVDLPPIINLGILRGACQCRCIHCPVGLVEPSSRADILGRSELDCATFARFCEDIRHYQTTVRLHAVGEPTLHTRFGDFMQIITDRGLQDRFWLFTCGLIPDLLHRPIVESFGIIEVSINSVNAWDYHRTKGIDRFADVVLNVNAMRRLALRIDKPARIILTRVASGDEDDEAFTDYWRTQGFECFVRSYHSYSGILSSRGDDQGASPAPGPKCLVPWRRLNLDGTLQPNRLTAVDCFNVLFQHPHSISGHNIMGQYPDTSLTELWNNTCFGDLRYRMTNRIPTGTQCDRCRECLTNCGPRSEGIIDHTNVLS